MIHDTVEAKSACFPLLPLRGRALKRQKQFEPTRVSLALRACNVAHFCVKFLQNPETKNEASSLLQFFADSFEMCRNPDRRRLHFAPQKKAQERDHQLPEGLKIILKSHVSHETFAETFVERVGDLQSH